MVLWLWMPVTESLCKKLRVQGADTDQIKSRGMRLPTKANASFVLVWKCGS